MSSGKEEIRKEEKKEKRKRGQEAAPWRKRARKREGLRNEIACHEDKTNYEI